MGLYHFGLNPFFRINFGNSECKVSCVQLHTKRQTWDYCKSKNHSSLSAVFSLWKTLQPGILHIIIWSDIVSHVSTIHLGAAAISNFRFYAIKVIKTKNTREMFMPVGCRDENRINQQLIWADMWIN